MLVGQHDDIRDQLEPSGYTEALRSSDSDKLHTYQSVISSRALRMWVHDGGLDLADYPIANHLSHRDLLQHRQLPRVGKIQIKSDGAQINFPQRMQDGPILVHTSSLSVTHGLKIMLCNEPRGGRRRPIGQESRTDEGCR